MVQIAEKRMIKAMRENDAQYNGQFYVGVHSTRIYCLPSCPARLPHLKNVVFYRTREEAIARGLRGCKRCHSEHYPDILPRWYHVALKYMKTHLDEKLSEPDLMEMTGVEISTIRRCFVNRLGKTPLAFHRELRLGRARQLIEEGADYLTAAFECGWESSSGFRDAFKKHYGHAPGKFYGRS